jgi:hypothetical protein
MRGPSRVPLREHGVLFAPLRFAQEDQFIYVGCSLKQQIILKLEPQKARKKEKRNGCQFIGAFYSSFDFYDLIHLFVEATSEWQSSSDLYW